MFYRQRDDKGCPTFRVIEYVDAAILLFNKTFADRQSQSGSFRLGSIKWIKYHVESLLVNTMASVGYTNLKGFICSS